MSGVRVSVSEQQQKAEAKASAGDVVACDLAGLEKLQPLSDDEAVILVSGTAKSGKPAPEHQRAFIGAKHQQLRLRDAHVSALFERRDAEPGAKAGEPSAEELQLLGSYKGRARATLPRDVQRELADIERRLAGWNRYQSACKAVEDTKGAYLAHVPKVDEAEALHRVELKLAKERQVAADQVRAVEERARAREERLHEELETMKREAIARASSATTHHVGADKFLSPHEIEQSQNRK